MVYAKIIMTIDNDKIDFLHVFSDIVAYDNYRCYDDTIKLNITIITRDEAIVTYGIDNVTNEELNVA